MAKSYVLLSGGLDSTAVLTGEVVLHGKDKVVAVSVDYGQRHSVELEHAKEIAAALDVTHRIISLQGVMGIGGLTDKNLAVPQVAYADLPEGISPTYVPFRNGLMLAALASQAMADPEAQFVVYGAHAEDAERDAYPDCSLSFVQAMADAIYIGTYNQVYLKVPFVSSTKADVVRFGVVNGAPFHLSWSCYHGGDVHCGVCSTCRARKDAFIAAGVDDPTVYADVVAAAEYTKGKTKTGGKK